MSAFALAAYRSATIETISQRDLIVRMFAGAESLMVRAGSAMEGQRIEEAHNCCRRARDIFCELLSTLNMPAGGEVAVQLYNLYLCLITRITEANLRKQASLIGELVPIVRTLREGWEQVPDEFANTTAVPGSPSGHSFSLNS